MNCPIINLYPGSSFMVFTTILELSTLRIILLVILGLLFIALTIFICACCCRTYRRLHRHDAQTAPLLDNEASFSQSVYVTNSNTVALDYNETLERTRRVYQPTPFTQARNMENTEPPPRYVDLYGSQVQPYNNIPSFLLDGG